MLPKEPFLEWLRAVDPSSAGLGLDVLREEPPVYLLPQGEDRKTFEDHLKKVAKEIFEEELRGWWTNQADWPPIRSFDKFRKWFDWQFHSLVIDLHSQPIIHEPR